jgi:uncharacterized protein (TIGR02001 family)
MNKFLTALVATLAVSALPQFAQAEDNPLSFNASVTNDYRYRGLSQSRFKPAAQAGVDYAIPGGFYVGAWASTIRWIKDAGDASTGGLNLEVDLYGGYKGEVEKDFSYDVGLLQYLYPGSNYAGIAAGNKSANTTEIYGALTFGPATVKYSHSISTLFGFANSKNSGYIEGNASFDVGGGVTIAPHVGYQRVAKNGDYSYADFSVAVSKEFYGFMLSGAVVGTNAKKLNGNPVYYSPSNQNLGKTGLVVAVKKTF